MIYYQNIHTILFKYLNVKKNLKSILQECVELNWRVPVNEKLVDTNQLTVQSAIRTLVQKKLWRPEQQYPKDCMAECRQMDFTNIVNPVNCCKCW